MFDSYSRPISYLRISVTDRCNLRCAYCMPDSGFELTPSDEILRFEEIEAVVAFGVQNGIRKIRLTGGEPLMRRGIETLVKKLAAIEGITDFGMTTNGQRLAEFAVALKAAGLHRLNISLDTVIESEFARITRGGRLADTLAGIAAAKAAGFCGTKLNCVINESADEKNPTSVRHFAEQEGLEVRFIRQMNTELGEFWSVLGGDGGNCSTCNRLRLSCQGFLYPCLFSDISFSIRKLGIEKAFREALHHKPECGFRSQNRFHQIGG